jgi:hypothetical protein
VKNVITGRGAFIDYSVSGQVFTCSLAWLEKFCTPTLDLPGVGTVEIPTHFHRLNSTVFIPNLELRIINA